MNRFTSLFLVSVFGTFLLMGALATFRVPEAQSVRSADGAITVTGLARSAQDIAVHADTDVSLGLPLLGLAYRVDPSHVLLDAPMVLSFVKRADLGTEHATTVFQWHSSLGMWVPVPSVVADTDELLAVEVLQLGSFALGTMPNIDMPTLLTAQDALRAKAPAGTRGYQISTAYTLPGGVPVQWPAAHVLGGCGGRVGAGERAEYSSVEQVVNLLVDDVSTSVRFTLVGEWLLSGDGTGCPASIPLTSQGASF